MYDPAKMHINELYQELIIDHGTEPRNYYKLQDYSCCYEGYNPLCGDKITIFIKLNNQKITAISFEGSGCAISIASASLLTEHLAGKTIAEAQELFSKFHNLLTAISSTTPCISLGKLTALSGVRKYPSRIKCATLAWHTLTKALENAHQ